MRPQSSQRKSTLSQPLPAKIVRMRALDADAMDRLGGDVNGELERVNDEMKSFEETLRSLGDKDA